MLTRDQIRCFVAMAFDRMDTDDLYDSVIVPTLRAESIVPLRVDRIEHNENINDRIMVELRRCALAVADLTYARPSVYYEAGFAERAVPVIYTCRRDHLKSRPDDEHGNLRVHFDLQMRNIITWSEPRDQEFGKRLLKRIRKVVAPLIRRKKEEEVLARAAEEFGQLSLIEKRDQIKSVVVEELLRAGFNRGKAPDQRSAEWIGIRRIGRVVEIATILIPLSTSKKELAWPIHWQSITSLLPVRAFLSRRALSTIRGARQHFFLCSLRGIPPARVSEALYHFTRDAELDAYTHRTTCSLELNKKVPATVLVHVIDSIRSTVELAQKLRDRLSRAFV